MQSKAAHWDNRNNRIASALQGQLMGYIGLSARYLRFLINPKALRWAKLNESSGLFMPTQPIAVSMSHYLFRPKEGHSLDVNTTADGLFSGS